MSLLGLGLAAVLFLGTVLGMVVGVKFAAIDLRAAHETIVSLRNQLLGAGIWPEGAPEALRSQLATPTELEGR